MRLLHLLPLVLLSSPAFAGPPFVNDDPVPTVAGHFETYLFATGSTAHDGSGGATGVDFNYGAAKDLQLTAVLPLEWASPAGASGEQGIGNVELAAKYRFAHQDAAGVEFAFFPRLGLTAYLCEHLHLMASAGPGLMHPATNDRAVWYAALQLTC